jgi:hypothetical protein
MDTNGERAGRERAENEVPASSVFQNMMFTDTSIDSGGGNVTVGSYNVINIINIIVHNNTAGVEQEDNHEDVLKRIERFLGPFIVHGARLEKFHRMCYPGTRQDLLDSLLAWIKGDAQILEQYRPLSSVFPMSQRCICIVGRPGSGKSTIARTIISQLPDLINEDFPLLAAHYCIRRISASTDTPWHGPFNFADGEPC